MTPAKQAGKDRDAWRALTAREEAINKQLKKETRPPYRLRLLRNLCRVLEKMAGKL